MRNRIVIDPLRPWPTAVSLREIAAGTGLSAAETRQAVTRLVAKGVLVVQPGEPSSEPHYALNLVPPPTLLRIDQ
jgi:DNA-binding GntR family transcriptional regulator